ncbi:6091_t:CDS:2 [Funneliformis caledonium]|uniref:6091_t:CDS:1 n=1 Tax=Funneliformis caledonium TaxID=1117310 RepID=A0A9N9EHW1_9GLOM|nr:6091_t:CDS:2 [Funneliformis caledonium]
MANAISFVYPMTKHNLYDVPSKFFRHINEICKEFLTPHILAVTQNQMKHSFFYDAYLMDRNFIQQIDNMDYDEGFREDDYETPQILLQSMIRNIQNVTIIKIWEIKPELSQTKSHFVILMLDESHSCTCNFLISFGIPCRHFYKVLRKSPEAKFHISLINRRWYHDLKLSITDEELALLNVISIVEDSSEATVYREMNFGYIHQVRDGQVYTEKLQKQNMEDEKQQELLQDIDKENIENNHQENNEPNIICSNPVTSRRRGHPPNRYLSEGETANQNKKRNVTNLELEHTTENEVNDGDNKKQRRCKGCKGIGHDLRNCKSKPLSERN